MKKLWLVFFIFGLFLGIFAGCGTKSESQTETTEENTVNVENNTAANDESDHEHDTENVTPIEPREGERCSICNMIVYHKDHEMGKFTGQVVTADGEHLFTDDVGCLMNQIRILEEEPLAAWVRDYNTLEWVPVSEAAAVKANIQTPMKMGFALFTSEESANQFITENPDLEPVLSSMEAIDQIAEQRYKAKMEKMKEAQEKEAGNMNQEMNHEGMNSN